jgi:hypothetical protein
MLDLINFARFSPAKPNTFRGFAMGFGAITRGKYGLLQTIVNCYGARRVAVVRCG